MWTDVNAVRVKKLILENPMSQNARLIHCIGVVCVCGQVVDLYSDIVFNFGVMGNVHESSSLSLMTDGTLYPGHPSY